MGPEYRNWVTHEIAEHEDVFEMYKIASWGFLHYESFKAWCEREGWERID